MPKLPTLNLSEPIQQVVIIAAGVIFLSLLVVAIWRAVRPRKLVFVPMAPMGADPYASADNDPAPAPMLAPPVNGDPTVVPPVLSSTHVTSPEPVRADAPASQIVSDGNTEFVQVWPHQLSKLTVVAQALDNQWLTRKMLADMRRQFTTSTPWGLADLHDLRRQVGRAEYVRALINSRQLVANRVFLYNTDYVAEDYVQAGDTRQAFIELLNHGAIVPYLFSERSPSETPRDVEKVEAVFAQWKQVCQEALVRGVRLDWDDERNTQECRLLNGRFALWLHGLPMLQNVGDIKTLAAQVGLAPEQIPAFQRRLQDVSNWTLSQEGMVLRGAFYREFVAAPDTAIPDGVIDFDANRKPFAAELKQLADLSYTTNLPDALGGYALTPMDSLPRTVLQELNVNVRQRDRILSEADLKTLLQRDAFSEMSAGLFLNSMGRLTLRDVIELRATDDWHAYIQELEGLLDNPLEFTQRSQSVSSRYIALADRMTERVKTHDTSDALERWSPVVKLILTVGTASLSMWGNPFGASTAGKILYSVSEGAVGQVANLTARMIIGGVADSRAEAELESSLDFLRGRVDGAHDAWADLIGTLRSDPRFVDRTRQPDSSMDEFDPNINYQESIETIAV